jgi:hypothetical protein
MEGLDPTLSTDGSSFGWSQLGFFQLDRCAFDFLDLACNPEVGASTGTQELGIVSYWDHTIDPGIVATVKKH